MGWRRGSGRLREVAGDYAVGRREDRRDRLLVEVLLKLDGPRVRDRCGVHFAHRHPERHHLGSDLVAHAHDEVVGGEVEVTDVAPRVARDVEPDPLGGDDAELGRAALLRGVADASALANDVVAGALQHHAEHCREHRTAISVTDTDAQNLFHLTTSGLSYVHSGRNPRLDIV